MNKISFYHSLIFFNLCIFLSAFEYLRDNNLLILSLFLILSVGISHGALDHVKGQKLIKILNFKSIISFYVLYILIGLSIIFLWLIFPKILLFIFLVIKCFLLVIEFQIPIFNNGICQQSITHQLNLRSSILHI